MYETKQSANTALVFGKNLSVPLKSWFLANYLIIWSQCSLIHWRISDFCRAEEVRLNLETSRQLSWKFQVFHFLSPTFYFPSPKSAERQNSEDKSLKPISEPRLRVIKSDVACFPSSTGLGNIAEQ